MPQVEGGFLLRWGGVPGEGGVHREGAGEEGEEASRQEEEGEVGAGTCLRTLAEEEGAQVLLVGQA